MEEEINSKFSFTGGVVKVDVEVDAVCVFVGSDVVVVVIVVVVVAHLLLLSWDYETPLHFQKRLIVASCLAMSMKILIQSVANLIKHFTTVIYDSRVVFDLKLPHITTLES